MTELIAAQIRIPPTIQQNARQDKQGCRQVLSRMTTRPEIAFLLFNDSNQECMLGVTNYHTGGVDI